MTKRITAWIATPLLLAAAATGSVIPSGVDASLAAQVITRDNDDFDIPEPAYDEVGDYVWADGAYYTTVFQAGRALSPEWLLRRVGVLGDVEAENVNAHDEVPDSTWFTNRHGLMRMSPGALARGPASGEAPRGPWTVIKGKRVGRSAGFVARDGSGQLVFVKLDDPDHPGLGTNADVIVSRFLHAAGYNVPEYHSVWIEPDSIALGPGATTPGQYKVERPMTAGDLEALLERAPRDASGRILAGISVGLPGKPKGPFKYEGTREDDPNDTVRHEDRRELRGLRLFMAWFNNTDARRGNTLDVYVIGQGGRRYLRHYLLDFSDGLGVRDSRPKELQTGHEYFLDPEMITRSLTALGLWIKPWECAKSAPSPAYGRYEARFDPAAWRGDYPNPAFRRMGARDAFWAARIIASFTDDDIRTLVGSGVLRDPDEAERLARILAERRDAIARYGFDEDRVNPLDAFRIEDAPGEPASLRFRDLAVAQGFAQGSSTRYRYRVGRGAAAVTANRRIPLPVSAPVSVAIETSRDGDVWSHPVTLDVVRIEGAPVLVRIRR